LTNLAVRQTDERTGDSNSAVMLYRAKKKSLL